MMMTSLFESLMSLKQTHTVNEFVSHFEWYARELKGLDEEHIMDVFLNGLKEEIVAELKLNNPKTLFKIMSIAKKIEEKIQQWQGQEGTKCGSQQIHNRAFPMPIRQENTIALPQMGVDIECSLSCFCK